MFIFSLIYVGEDEVITNKFKRNEEKVRFLRVLDKSQNAKYSHFIDFNIDFKVTELILTLLSPSDSVGK